MCKYYYLVNTFKDEEPIQVKGYIEAFGEEEAIQKLINNGVVYPYAYEFLDLYMV